MRSRDAEPDRDAAILLAVHAEPGDRAVRALAARHGVRRAWDDLCARRGWTGAETAEQHLAKADALGLRILVAGDGEWPMQLAALGVEAPYALWVHGAAHLRLSCLRSIAMVGARAATPYGLRIAHDWAAATADARGSVISGAAIGIDGAAHRGALAAEGMTVAVLAGGVDIAYPRAHEQLLARIADEGLLVSESPPGARPFRHRFLTRNRIIAALSVSTVIVEAAHRSGTIATAHAAARLGREVFAVPGPVTSDMSDGCHRLIAEGIARIARSANDVIDCLLPLEDRVRSAADRDARLDAVSHRATDDLTQQQSRVLDAIPLRGGCTEDEIADRSHSPIPSVLTALGYLEAVGLIHRTERGWSRRA